MELLLLKFQNLFSNRPMITVNQLFPQSTLPTTALRRVRSLDRKNFVLRVHTMSFPLFRKSASFWGASSYLRPGTHDQIFVEGIQLKAEAGAILALNPFQKDLRRLLQRAGESGECEPRFVRKAGNHIAEGRYEKLLGGLKPRCARLREIEEGNPQPPPQRPLEELLDKVSLVGEDIHPLTEGVQESVSRAHTYSQVLSNIPESLRPITYFQESRLIQTNHLGTGSYASVYKISTGDGVSAVKFFPATNSDAKLLRSLQRELRAYEKMTKAPSTCPYVVAMKGLCWVVCEDNSLQGVGLVMELCKHGDLC